MQEESLRITEIFYSLQGETRTVGLPTVFVRLTGCPLRCQYCDSAYAFEGGQKIPLLEVMETVLKYPARYVTVTGGEPLAQPNCLKLLTLLCDRGYEVSLETSGAMDISGVDPRVSVVLDIKTPGSGESSKNKVSNYQFLLPNHQVKFVICDRNDFNWSKVFIETHELDEKCEILFSPSSEQCSPTDLADWILEDRLQVRFQLQLHKVLWGDVPGK